MNPRVTESIVEQAALDWLGGLGYEVLSGLAIAPGEPAAERTDYKQVFLFDRLQSRLAALNPKIPTEGLQEALRKVRLFTHPTLIENNRAFHRLLVEGVDVEFRNKAGEIVHDKVWLIDFANPGANEFLAVNQFTVEEGHFNRRADVVVFINGIPLAVLELKNIADEQATIRKAFDQFQTYKAQIPSLFHTNALLVISDVCMSRRICYELYEAIRKLRPQWHDEDDSKGVMKIVMSGSASDKLEWQPHIRNKSRREELAKKFKDSKHPFKIVIVRDMWLTGFDAPCLHTMYADKPMKSHGLMQAIARVNRVFKDKPGGLVVDYLGLAEELKLALVDYTNSKGKGEIKLDQEEAVAVMLEKYEQVCAILHGFDYQSAAEATPAQRMPLIAQAAEHVLQQENGKARYLLAVRELALAFALSVPHEQALEIRDEVGFFQEVRAVLAKSVGPDGGKSPEELDAAVRQIVSRAVASDKVIDIFDAAGLKKPDISILSDEFLAEVQHMPQRNLAVELLQKLLNNELKIRSKKYLVQSRSFAEMLEATIRKYQNRTIEAAQVIAELIELAKQMRAGQKRGEDLGLTDDEVAFYDSLEVNDSAVKVLGEPTLKDIARELVTQVRKSVTIDWTLREAAQAQIRVIVRRILRKYGYPPDKQEKATQTVLEQAKLLCAEWAA